MDEKNKIFRKQVEKSHYDFENYLSKKRWISVWHQIDEVLRLQPQSLLEIGPGSGLFKALAGHFNLSVETVDVDPELKPNYLASAEDLPFDDNSYDCVCAFQVLEHLPYKQFLKAFGEMVRVAQNDIVISLPDARTLWVYLVHIPKIGEMVFHIPKPFFIKNVHEFDGEHYWEINKNEFPFRKVLNDLFLISKRQFLLTNTYRVPENPHHRFLVFRKSNKNKI
ncbi:class I SAM-dependent methyltransferase [Desulforhopalus sp. 52FAK]